MRLRIKFASFYVTSLYFAQLTR